MKKYIIRKGGFTLIEVVLAIAIGLIIIAGVAVGYHYAKRAGILDSQPKKMVNNSSVGATQANSTTATTNQAQPSITITSPNGGEQWAIGSTHNITWNAVGLPGTSVDITAADFSNAAGVGIKPYDITANNIKTSNGSYLWKIPSTITPGSQFKIIITFQAGITSETVQGQSKNYFAITAPTANQTAGWSADGHTYIDSINGITFQYPNNLNNSNISLYQKPSVIITTQTNSSININSNGCYNIGKIANNTQLTLNNMQFCLSYMGEGTAGTGYTTYDYTTFKNGNYYTLEYIIAEPDCGIVDGPGQNTCTNAQSTTVVTQQIQQSVETLQFTK